MKNNTAPATSIVPLARPTSWKGRADRIFSDPPKPPPVRDPASFQRRRSPLGTNPDGSPNLARYPAVSNRMFDDPLIRGALKERADPLVKLADNLDRMRVIKQDLTVGGVYTEQVPPDNRNMQFLNKTRAEEGNPPDIGRDTVVLTGQAVSSKTVLTHELRHRAIAIIRERIPWKDFRRRYLQGVDLFTQRQAWEIFQFGPSASASEAFVNSFDQDAPVEPNQTIKRRQVFKEQDVKTQTALGNLERPFFQAANDLLIEDGRTPIAQPSIKRGWLAGLFRGN